MATSFKQDIRRLAQNTVAWAVTNPKALSILNHLYRGLTPTQQAWFYREFAKLFRERAGQGQDGIWGLEFLGQSLVVPLTMTRLWLDWDIAVSILGHDLEVKETYKALLISAAPPELFVDIGANYGTHSLLFLRHGVTTLTFEPNPACHDYFRELCALNALTPCWQPVALGAVTGSLDLCFPENETWLGTTHRPTQQVLAAQGHQLQVISVPQHTLDSYRSHFESKRALIKIDTEGNELAVLQGAAEILQRFKPGIILEAWQGNARKELWLFLQTFGYTFYSLPWLPLRPSLPLSWEQFAHHPGTNFLALATLPPNQPTHQPHE